MNKKKLLSILLCASLGKNVMPTNATFVEWELADDYYDSSYENRGKYILDTENNRLVNENDPNDYYELDGSNTNTTRYWKTVLATLGIGITVGGVSGAVEAYKLTKPKRPTDVGISSSVVRSANATIPWIGRSDPLLETVVDQIKDVLSKIEVICDWKIKKENGKYVYARMKFWDFIRQESLYLPLTEKDLGKTASEMLAACGVTALNEGETVDVHQKGGFLEHRKECKNIITRNLVDSIEKEDLEEFVKTFLVLLMSSGVLYLEDEKKNVSSITEVLLNGKELMLVPKLPPFRLSAMNLGMNANSTSFGEFSGNLSEHIPQLIKDISNGALKDETKWSDYTRDVPTGLKKCVGSYINQYGTKITKNVNEQYKRYAGGDFIKTLFKIMTTACKGLNCTETLIRNIFNTNNV